MWKKGPPPDDGHYWVMKESHWREPYIDWFIANDDDIQSHWLPVLKVPPNPPGGLWTKLKPSRTGYYWIRTQDAGIENLYTIWPYYMRPNSPGHKTFLYWDELIIAPGIKPAKGPR